MKGLLRKDLYMTLAYFRIFLAMMALFLVVGYFAEDSMFLIIYPMIIGMMLPVSLLSYDERFHWNRTCDAMPCSRAQVVSSKYLLTLLSVLLLFALTMLIQGLRLSRLGHLEELASLAPLLLGLGLVGPALLLPIVFWLGVEKGRIAYYIAVGAVVAVGVGIGMNSDGAPAFSASVWAPIAATILLFAASWLLSIRLYEKREL